MKLTKREFSLLAVLKECPDISLKEISKKLHITQGTVKKEFVELQKLFREYNIEVDLMSKGSMVKHGRGNLPGLLNDAEKMIEFSIHDQILLFLVLHYDFQVMQDIADQVYVSKSLVEKQIAVILKEYGGKFQTIRHYGIQFVSSEAERRELFVGLILPYLSGISYYEELLSFHKLHFPILNYMEMECLEKAENILDMMMEIAPFSLTDESRNLFFLYVFFMLNGLKKNGGCIENTFVDVLKKMPVSQVHQFEGIVSYIEEAFELELPQEEKAYLTYVLMTLRKQNVLNIERILQETAGMMHEIFQRVLDRYYIDLSQDKKLVEGLSLHIYSTVMRKDFHGEVYAAYQIRDIKKQYPLGFEMAVIAAGVIEEEYEYKVNDNEMSYLALHFQAALERIKNQEEKLKAVVVCKYGMAAASLISAKIQRFFPQIEIVAIASRHEFLSRGEEAYEADFVLSTDKLPIQLPIIRVTPALNDVEVKQIEHVIYQQKTMKQISLYIAGAQIFIRDFATKTEAIQFMTDYLKEQGAVDEKYGQSVLDREKISATNDGIIAIPHGNAKYVKDTRMVITKLVNPVQWGEGEPVRYVFLFAFSKEALENNNKVFSEFYRGLANPRLEAQLEELQDEEINQIKQIMMKCVDHMN